MAKFIFVTGGVLSSLGKGISASSIGALMEARGLKVTHIKMDPYINVDPGTMNPYQHGEVYVTEDGAETDLDLGHYERFVSTPMGAKNNVTTGMVYKTVIDRERRGEYLGATVQVVPHISDEIKKRIRGVEEDFDIVICEIGGTVGDIESLPFLESIRQFRFDVGRDNVLYAHVTLVPYIETADELKTKPTQHSVKSLRAIGIQPDILLCRTKCQLTEPIKAKLGLFCNMEKNEVITARDVQSIYDVPLVFHDEGLDDLVVKKLQLTKARPIDLTMWEEISRKIKNPACEVTIGIVGKYVELKESYKSLYEALNHGGLANNCRVNLCWVEAEDIEKEGDENILGELDGILVPGGFGARGVEGKISAVRYARTNNVPFFGICLGLHCAVIEYARNKCGIKEANSSEMNPDTIHPVIDFLPDQAREVHKGGTMRLGSYTCKLRKDTKAFEAYGVREICERHRHRYEFNNQYRIQLEEAGLKFSGLSPDANLVEIVEIPEHPWFLAVQYHPEFKSTPRNPHPLFVGFVRAAVAKAALSRASGI